MSAYKNDRDKPRLDLLPMSACIEVARVMTKGAETYGCYNYKEGMDWHRLEAAALRHLFTFWGGEDNDPDTGLSHLAHAACCCLMLLTYQIEDLGCDDRYNKNNSSQEQAERSWPGFKRMANKAALRNLKSGGDKDYSQVDCAKGTDADAIAAALRYLKEKI